MPISTIGSDALASSSVTRPKIGYAGAVLQVVNSILTSKVTTTSSSFVDTGLSVSITPTFASSKFLITISGTAGIGSNGLDRVYFLVTGMTSTNVGDAGAGGTRCTSVVNPRSADTGWAQSAIDIKIMDTPATTSTRTYSLQWKTNSSYPAALNSAYNNDALVANTPATMTVMEIAA
jgi:hypothetical protein